MNAEAFDTVGFTPRAIQVLTTAKWLASPTRLISARDIVVALEIGPSVASAVLNRLEICPSAQFGVQKPESVSGGILYRSDFEPEIRAQLSKACWKEARDLAEHYIGSHHILLALARIGGLGTSLPYDALRGAIADELQPAQSGSASNAG